MENQRRRLIGAAAAVALYAFMIAVGKAAFLEYRDAGTALAIGVVAIVLLRFCFRSQPSPLAE